MTTRLTRECSETVLNSLKAGIKEATPSTVDDEPFVWASRGQRQQVMAFCLLHMSREMLSTKARREKKGRWWHGAFWT